MTQIARQVVAQDFHGSTGTITYAKPSAAGSLLLLDAAVGGGTTVNLHADAGWVLLGSRVDHSTNLTLSTWAMVNASAQSGSVSVDVVLASDDTTPSIQYGDLFLSEYPGMAITSIVDQLMPNNGSGTLIDTGATPATGTSNDVAHTVAACSNAPPVADLHANTTGYTLLAEAHDASSGTARVTAAVYEKQLGASGGGFQFTTVIDSTASRAWVVQAFALKPAAGSGGTPAQPPCQGAWKRDATSIEVSYRPDMGGFSPRVQWSQLQALNNGTLNGPDVAVVDNAITEAVAEGKTMKLRIFCGYQSPTWLINQVGSFKYKDPANTSNPVVDVPCFWKQAYLDAYDALIALIAARWGGGGTLLDVTIANAMTYYAEPFQRHLTASQNRAAMVGGGIGWNGTFISPANSAGYTDALNKAALRAGIDSHAAHLPNVCSSLSFNPYQTLTSYSVFDTNDDATLSITRSFITYLRQALGSRGVVENNSAKKGFFVYDGNGNATGTDPTAGSMAKLYDAIAQAGPPTFIQTATSARIGDLDRTLSGCDRVLGANAVEIPSDFVHQGQTDAAYAPANIGAWNTRLIANPTGAGTTAVNKPVTDSIHLTETVSRTVITSGVISKQVADTVTLSDAVSVTQIPGVPAGAGTGKKYPKA